MAGFTNKGKMRLLGAAFRGVALPTNFYVALVDDSVSPTQDTNTLSQLGEVPAGNGYTAGGIQLTPGATDFDVLTEDDSGDMGLTQIKDLVWTASGGNLPTSGTGARWAVLTDDHATLGSREIWAYFSLTSNRIVSVGQPLTLQNCEMRLTEA